ncbi:MAG TPA: DUF4157 domain-containing protein, partial [Acidimicrobiales bacterium]|nr:DUF4157 domain-containing protein [Acidimicrobiales bacterium]
MPPSFPDMPVVVSTHFDQDLVARRPPELFIGELGHAVSESAPAGMVEAVAVLVPVPVPVGPPGPATQAAAEESALTLATPPRPERAPRARPETVRRVPGFDRGDPAATETVDEDELEADGGSQDAPQPPAETAVPPAGEAVGPPPEVAPAALVGAEPLVPGLTPLVVPIRLEDANRLIQAPVPPDMPLAELPATPLPPAPEPRREATPAPEASAGLLGDRPIEAAPPAGGPPQVQTPAPPPRASVAGPTGPAEGDLPLVTPPAPATPGRDVQVRRLPGAPEAAPPEAEAPASPAPAGAGPPAGAAPASADTADADTAAADTAAAGPSEAARVEAAPLVGAAEPLVPDPTGVTGDAPAGPAPLEPPGAALGRADLPLAVPPAAAPIGAGDEEAPLIGLGPALVAGSEPLVPGPAPAEPLDAGQEAAPPLAAAPSPRTGLGEPMQSLPTTASPMNISSMTRAQQLQMSRNLIQAQLAARSRTGAPAGEAMPLATAPSAGAGAPSTVRRLEPSFLGPVTAGMPLAHAPIESVGPASEGQLPDDVAPAGTEVAPILSMDPLTLPGDPQPGPSQRPPSPEGVTARTAVGQRYGLDLSAVPVDRSPQGAAIAHQMGARAFTSDLKVVIPQQVGSLESGPGEALLAHELTHVAQRMRHDGPVPSESSPAGRAMEAEATSAEMTLNMGGFLPTSTLEPPLAPNGLAG